MEEIVKDERPDVLVCQFCGRAAATSSDTDRDWFVDEHRNFPGVFIIRCPLHISEWAMRNSKSGRIKKNREKARRGKTLDVPETAYSDPMPTKFIGADTRRVNG